MLPVGIVMAFVFMLGSNVMEGGDPMALFAIPSVVLVIGGTLAATATTFTVGEVFKMPSLFFKAFKKPMELEGTITQLCELAEVARKTRAPVEIHGDRIELLVEKRRIESVEVVTESGDSATVKFNLNLIKEITYTLKLTGKKNETVSWSLVSGQWTSWKFHGGSQKWQVCSYL